MRQRDIRLLILIGVILAVTVWVSWPTNPGVHIHWGPINIDYDIDVHQGLDLQGGVAVLLEADVPADQEVTADAMDAARVKVD